MSRLTKRQRLLSHALAGDAEAMDALVCLPTPKKRAAPKKREAPRQIAIVVYLRKHLPQPALVWHTPNHQRSENHGHFLRSMGQVSGIPDLFVLTQARMFGIEVKDAGQGPTEAQRWVHEQLGLHGVPCAVVNDVAGAVTFLQSMGVAIK